MNPRASKVIYESPAKLVVTFTNSEVREFNMQPYLSYPVYQHLQNEALLSLPKVSGGVVVWDEETDLDPDRLYLESMLLVY